MLLILVEFFFFFKQKTAYEMRISDWSSDVCSSDLPAIALVQAQDQRVREVAFPEDALPDPVQRHRIDGRRARGGGERRRTRHRRVRARGGQIGRASCGERVCQYV